jgi:nucleoside-diphosphate-sugar epimerase
VRRTRKVNSPKLVEEAFCEVRLLSYQLGCGPETVTTRKFVEMIFEEVGKPARLQAAPKIVLRAVGLFNPGIRETIEMLYEFEEPFVVDDSGFERAFGKRATPLREAIERTVRWYREERPAGT